MPTLTAEEFNELHKASDLLYSKEAIHGAIQTMAEAIKRDLGTENIVVMPIMNGGMMPATHLIEKLSDLDCPYTIDYIHATHYANELTGSNSFVWPRVPDKEAIAGKTIVLVDDVLDSAVTLTTVVKKLIELGAARVETAIMFDKDRPRAEDVLQKATYTGITLENRFLYGFGLDMFQRARGLSAVYAANLEKLDEILERQPKAVVSEKTATETTMKEDVSFKFGESSRLSFHAKAIPQRPDTPRPPTAAAAAANDVTDENDGEHTPIAHHNK